MHGRIALAALAALALLAPPASAHDGAHPGVDHGDTPSELAATPIAQIVEAAQVFSEIGGVTEALPDDGWCGEATTADDVADARYDAALPQFKVIYAYPADRPNRFATWAGVLQANASVIEQFVALQEGSARAPRFDLGTICGPDYVDIQTVALPSGRSAYMNNFGAVVNAVRARVNQSPGGARNYVILADTLGSSVFGQGQLYAGGSADSPDGALHDAGGLSSVIWVPDGTAPSSNAPWWPTGMLHEMAHNMGAVQWSAPHTTQPAGTSNYTYSHCWDGTDIMCYQDGPAPARNYTNTVCAPGEAPLWSTFDCNQDDYFNPAPSPGSYLDTHWNVYDSAFLGECTDLGTCTPSPPKPVNTAMPAISGTPAAARTITATTGTWTGADEVAVRWQRCATTCTDIAGATGTSYTTDLADVGRRLRVVATATTSLGGRSAALSAQTALVPTPPAASVAPSIAGIATTGRVLTLNRGTWSGTLTFAYRWQRCNSAGEACADVAGATATTYALTDTDLGTRMRGVVTATSATLGSRSLTTAPSAAVKVPYVNTDAPSVSGTARVGSVLTAGAGTWTPQTEGVRYQWLRCSATACGVISGATAQTYTVTPTDYPHRLAVRITPLPDLVPVASSAQTANVTYPPLVDTVAPAITGLARVADTMTVSRGTWSHGLSTLSLQWRRCTADGTACSDLTGARAASYVAAQADSGNTLRVHVVATGVDGQVVAMDTAPVAISDAPLPQNTVAPTTTGGLRRYDVLTAVRGTWVNHVTAYTYQWRRCTDASASVCEDIAGATAPTHRLTLADEGSHMAVRVSARGAGGTASAQSAPRGPVVAFPPALVGAPTLTLSRAQQGVTVGSTAGRWTTSADTTFARRWQRCSGTTADTCIDIAGATGVSYTLTAADVGQRVRLLVTATNPDGSLTAASAMTAAVVPPAPRLVTAPSITGTVAAGRTLTITPGVWANPVTTVVHQWQRCTATCANLAGQTATTYVPQATDVGTYLLAKETVTGPGGAAAVFTRRYGPVASTAAARTTLGSGPSKLLRTRDGLALVSVAIAAAPARARTASVGEDVVEPESGAAADPAPETAPAATPAPAATRTLTVRVTPRRPTRVVVCAPGGGACSAPRIVRKATTISLRTASRKVIVTATRAR